MTGIPLGRPAVAAMPPLLICSDLQKGLLADRDGRRADDVDAALARCRVLIDTWRSMGWPIAHLKRIAQPFWFDPASDLSDWIDDFRPRPGELAFEHALPSAYSSARFAEYMRNVMPTGSLLAGCSLDETILSTAIEGFHRGFHHQVVSDAVACRRAAAEIADYRDAVLHLLGTYSVRVCSAGVLGVAS